MPAPVDHLLYASLDGSSTNCSTCVWARAADRVKSKYPRRTRVRRSAGGAGRILSDPIWRECRRQWDSGPPAAFFTAGTGGRPGLRNTTIRHGGSSGAVDQNLPRRLIQSRSMFIPMALGRFSPGGPLQSPFAFYRLVEELASAWPGPTAGPLLPPLQSALSRISNPTCGHRRGRLCTFAPRTVLADFSNPNRIGQYEGHRPPTTNRPNPPGQARARIFPFVRLDSTPTDYPSDWLTMLTPRPNPVG